MTASARLDLCVLVLRLPARELGDALAELGPLELAATDEDGRAPICIELWDVHDGRVRVAGIEQERLYEGGAMLLGSAYGALLGPLGSMSGALLGKRLGGALSGAASQALGRYRELLIGVPEVRLRGGSPCYFVAGMRADSPFAIGMDRLLGYGFGKRAAIFGGSLASGLTIRDPQQVELMRARIEPVDGEHRAPSGVDFAHVKAWIARPLLAGADQRLVRSTLSRAYAPGDAVAAERAVLEIGGALHPWLGATEHVAAAFRVPSVAVELSEPAVVPFSERHRHA